VKRPLDARTGTRIAAGKTSDRANGRRLRGLMVSAFASSSLIPATSNGPAVSSARPAVPTRGHSHGSYREKQWSTINLDFPRVPAIQCGRLSAASPAAAAVHVCWTPPPNPAWRRLTHSRSCRCRGENSLGLEARAVFRPLWRVKTESSSTLFVLGACWLACLNKMEADVNSSGDESPLECDDLSSLSFALRNRQAVRLPADGYQLRKKAATSRRTPKRLVASQRHGRSSAKSRQLKVFSTRSSGR